MHERAETNTSQKPPTTPVTKWKPTYTGFPTASDTWTLVSPPNATLRTKATGQNPNTLEQSGGGLSLTSTFVERWLSKEFPQEEAAKGPAPKEAYTRSFPMACVFWEPPGRGGRTTGQGRFPQGTSSLQAGVAAAQHLRGDTCEETPVKGRGAHGCHD